MSVDYYDIKIKDALAALQAVGGKVTQAQVAAQSGLSIRTVKGRWHACGMVQDGAISGNAPYRGVSGPEVRLF